MTSATTKLTRVEGRLFLRDPIALFFGLVFPGVLLLALGLFFPGFDEPAAEFDGRRYVDIYASTVLVLGIATLGLVTLPPILGTYRQLGILRRLRTTPVSPARLLWAQLVVHGAVALASAVLTVAIAVLILDVPFPEAPLWFLVAFVLATASIFSIGLLVGARVRTTGTAAAIGMAVYFPLLFLGGLWVPLEVMPDGLRAVSDLSPLGAAVQALDDAWFGITPSAESLIVMVVWGIAAGALAVRFFRWE